MEEAGYEVVSEGADAELSVTYSEVFKTHCVRFGRPVGESPVPRQNRYLDMSIAMIDREHMEVLYREFDPRLPRTLPEGQCALDVTRGEIIERFRRFFRVCQWD